jgi:hypothetical protein
MGDKSLNNFYSLYFGVKDYTDRGECLKALLQPFGEGGVNLCLACLLMGLLDFLFESMMSGLLSVEEIMKSPRIERIIFMVYFLSYRSKLESTIIEY